MNKKTIGIVLSIIIGFALSYIPNNYMSEKYENIAFFIVVGIVLILVVKSLIPKKNKNLN
ncbi:hypothetical protein [Salegentibacter chungangensis]|uniref:Uncharacterized protein n=1 Tax=Salegentibacter chungangensis TaxID=1335724 RepID=A0ABW3NSX8_9FLAO